MPIFYITSEITFVLTQVYHRLTKVAWREQGKEKKNNMSVR